MGKDRIEQEEAQSDLIPRAEVDEIVRRLTENLEGRVKARTNDLRGANERLLREIEERRGAEERLRREIEERRAAEERLRESEELYRLTVELSHQLVWTASPDGRILSASSRFNEVTGLPPDIDPHQGWLSIVHPDDLQRIRANWSSMTRAGGRPQAGEFRLRVADGSYRTFRTRLAPRLDGRGNVVRWYGIAEDIHDRKMAEEARKQAEELYRLAARATNDAIWDLDLVEDKIHWSDSAADALGYHGQTLGTTPLSWWEERVHPEDRKQSTESLERAIKRGKARWSATYRFRKAGDEYATFFDRGFIVYDSEGKPLRAVGAMTDLTERQRAEQEIRRMQAELIHVSRLSAMGTMASTLAHELNQPLTAVTNYVRGSRRLLDSAVGPRLDETRQALEAAEAGALRAGQIVRRLRELVARGTSELAPEDLGKLIEDAGVIAFLDAHLLGVTHSIKVDPDAQWVDVDRIQVQQVLINLIRNSMQAMQSVERREIVVEARKASDAFVEVSVADTGDGISPEVRDALFSPFQGTKADGLGIGLSISRTIIEAHGGKIWAEDRDGGGSVFRFTLPRCEEPNCEG
ncbi:MAG TPA: PAS domain-containing protein [Allosphingosinicella sp.]|nr:PAS domain-containing protein [Allosphingosinicella sp.]